MLAKRLLAATVSVVLVVVAFVARSHLHGGTKSAASATTTTTASAATRVICAQELGDACQAVAPGADVEVAGDTIDRLSKANAPGHVVWVTLAPLPDLVDDLRARAGKPRLFTSSTPVASSRLVLVGHNDQMAALTAHCGGQSLWRCVGDVAGQPWTRLGGPAAWGTVKPAHESPASSATGMLSFANAVVGWFGLTHIATVDLDNDQFNAWLRHLERAIPYFGGPQGTPFEQMLLLPSVNVVGTTQAEVEARSGSRRGQLTVAYPSPMAHADVVLAGSTGASAPDLAAKLTTELRALGWDAAVGNDTSADGQVDGLPPADLLPALRDLWLDVVR